MSIDPLTLPLLPVDDDGPVFSEPWQAEAFALVLSLHQQGVFTWTEWADALASEIADARDQGGADWGETYYLHWLAALERLCVEKTALTPDTLAQRKARWRRAYLNTPHGQPVTMEFAD